MENRLIIVESKQAPENKNVVWLDSSIINKRVFRKYVNAEWLPVGMDGWTDNSSQIETDDEGFFITDSELNVILKINASGFDVPKLSEHFLSLLPQGINYELF